MKIAKAAKYVENLIPNRDLTSMFLFEKSEDMHYFLEEVREKLKIPVNASLVPQHKLKDFQPPRPLEEIK
jgi:hypothetical protein